MKILFLLVSTMVAFFSCCKNFYGTYNTNYSKDKSAFFQIKLNVDNTVEKIEVHSISDFAKGKFLIIPDNKIACYFDSSSSKFPPDTLIFKLKGKRLYFIRNGVFNKKTYLIKQ